MKRLDINERDLWALRIFKEVAFAGGFSAAKKSLNMTTATISRHIKDIEERIGVKLCTRGPQGFSLTHAGEAALSRIEDALDAVGRIMPAINETRDIISGNLNIGILDNIIENPDCHLTEAITELTDIAPLVTIDLQTIAKSDVVRSLLDHRFHITICGAVEESASINYYHLFDEIQAIYCLSKNRGLHHLPLVHRNIDSAADEITINNKYERGPSASGLQSVAFLISTGKFVGILPKHYAKQLSSRLRLHRVPDSPNYKIPFYAITNATRPLPPCAEHFIEILTKYHAHSL